MQDWEKMELPHCVYRLFAGETLVYVGCSLVPFGRHQGLAKQGWYREIDRATFEWFPNWHEGRVAEMRAINEEHPAQNKLVHDPETIGSHIMRAERHRGDGVHCPKCGGEKETRKQAYCLKCARQYREDRRARQKTALANRLNES